MHTMSDNAPRGTLEHMPENTALAKLPLPEFTGAKRLEKALAVRAAAAGASVREAAKQAGIGVGTAHRAIAKHEEFVEHARREHVRNVLERLDPATRARLEDAANADSKTGANSYRVLLESLGWIGKGNVTINGDVTNSVTLDQSQHQYLANVRSSDVADELDKLGSQLGLDE